MSIELTTWEIDAEFAKIAQQLEAELDEVRAHEQREAWLPPRPLPLPEGLICLGVPSGHIVNMGDFKPPSIE